MRILDCKIDQKFCEGAPTIVEHLDEECRTHFQAVQDHLAAMDIPYRLNPRLVRGLDYYTHTAFEYKAAGIGAIDTIGGGGRYNGLVGQIGGNDQPGVGLGLGLERILLVLQAQGVEIPAAKPLDVYLIGLGEAAEKETVKLLQQLRMQGLSAERDYQSRKIKAQMKSLTATAPLMSPFSAKMSSRKARSPLKRWRRASRRRCRSLALPQRWPPGCGRNKLPARTRIFAHRSSAICGQY